ncbi:hypothetical protein BPC006_II2779 [Burkholderia pseudomallei BPC006]|uniref:Uncharacterized protein n=1 Tax=Burkholderia pseudomallei (strain 1710b) TaxID=320372 RepID=Q3JJB6_BURP1|nr:hypothetical protein BURPS1710b_A1180 [Burkholderia pseudomallei 1710b]AFR20703.1 hypothetical protein BPC006_II2779 [Burkholderia pseudomallei BPC006]EDO89120.1 hypothetical protein BURPSPAST_AC0113 [Burkholderia pseudomallei Pasteur 52237]EDS83166.1 hypothetical protein BURPSS13_X0951 [Burkholderia pseudomallei S13]
MKRIKIYVVYLKCGEYQKVLQSSAVQAFMFK